MCVCVCVCVCVDYDCHSDLGPNNFFDIYFFDEAAWHYAR